MPSTFFDDYLILACLLFFSVVSTKVFVGSLPESVRKGDLQSLFEKFGTVVECDIIKDYGFVVCIAFLLKGHPVMFFQSHFSMKMEFMLKVFCVIKSIKCNGLCENDIIVLFISNTINKKFMGFENHEIFFDFRFWEDISG